MSLLKTDRAQILSEAREVLWFSLPIIVTMSSQTLMQMCDVWMLGEYGKFELAAVVPAGLAAFTLISFLIGLASCNNTFVSQSLGAGRPQDCARYTHQTIYIAIAVQVLILPVILVARHVFQLLPHEAQVQSLETTYFRIRALQLAASGMIVSLAGFFQGTGRPVVPMVTGIIANLLNVVGDYLLIFGHFGCPEMGIFGAAIATTGASYVEAILLLCFFMSRENALQYDTRHWPRVNLQKMRQVMRIGLWSAISFAQDVGNWSLFIAVAIGRLGTDVLAGNAAASQYLHLSIMPAVGVNIAVTAFVGKHIGKGDIAGAKRRAYLGMACACCYMTLMGIIFFLFRKPLIGAFSADPAVIKAGSVILTYVVLFQFSDAVVMVSRGALKGAGDTLFPAVSHMVLAWGIFLPAAVYLGRPDILGIHGAWASVTIYDWALAAIFFARFLSERWRKIDIFD